MKLILLSFLCITCAAFMCYCYNLYIKAKTEDKKGRYNIKLSFAGIAGSLAIGIPSLIALILAIPEISWPADSIILPTPTLPIETESSGEINLPEQTIPPETISLPSDAEIILGPLNGAPCLDDLEYIKSEAGYTIKFPPEKSLLPEYEIRYVKHIQEGAIYSYKGASASPDNRMGRVILEGTEVVVLARKNNMSCIVYLVDGEFKYCWVLSKYLTE